MFVHVSSALQFEASSFLNSSSLLFSSVLVSAAGDVGKLVLLQGMKEVNLSGCDGVMNYKTGQREGGITGACI